MSEIKVNKLSPRSGTTVTLGDSGDIFTVPSGVTLDTSASFWQAAQSSNFNASASKGYFVDTSSAAVTATLPASPSIGDEIHFVDQKYSFNTNALTIGRNGSNIARAASDLVVNTQGAGFSLVYSGDATTGWTYKDK